MNIRLGKKEYTISKKGIIIIIAILLLVIIIFILINKQKNELECTVFRSDATVSSEEKIIASFVNNKLSTLKVYYKNEPTDDFKYMLDDIFDNYNNQLIELKNNGGYDFNIKKGDDYVSYNATVDINLIPDYTKNKIGYNNEWTYKDVKADLERNEFVCK